jgi:transposase-like protein
MKNGAPYGMRHGKVKVPDSTVKEIRDRYFDRGDCVAAMAKEYGISVNTIWDWLKMYTRVHQ